MASRTGPAVAAGDRERDLELLGLLALEDPPRPDVAGLSSLPQRGHPGRHGHRRPPAHGRGHRPRGRPAAPGGVVLDGAALPEDDAARGPARPPDGVVVARVTPADKLRIARVLRDRGHVVAMTGDGVNDAPALREADVGVAMGASGSDVAREAADLVLLDDHFGTIVAAIELGRATFTNVRRFLTYHLTDNVAELTPFAVWALTGGPFPLAIGVLQVLALDIGTDMLPALALGAEPPSAASCRARPRRRSSTAPCWCARSASSGRRRRSPRWRLLTVLLLGGWRGARRRAPRSSPPPRVRRSRRSPWPRWPTPSPAAARRGRCGGCRRSATPCCWGRLAPRLLLVAFVGLPDLARLLGGSWPSAAGWLCALGGAALLVAADAAQKALRRRKSATPA